MSSEMISSPFIRLAGVSDTLHAPNWFQPQGWIFPVCHRKPLTFRSDARRQFPGLRQRGRPAFWRVVQSRQYAIRGSAVQFSAFGESRGMILRQVECSRLFTLYLLVGPLYWRTSAWRSTRDQIY